MINIFKNKKIFTFYLLLILFPWIQIYPKNETGIQPYVLLFSLLLFIFNYKFIKISYSVIIFIFYILIISILDQYNFLTIRALLAYFSFFFCYTIFYNFLNYTNTKNFNIKKIIIIVSFIYILAGLIQIYYDPDFFINFSNREKGYNLYQGRGVESLTVEPTYLGFHAIFIFIFYFLYQNYDYVYKIRLINFIKENKLTIFLLLFLLIFISRSASAIGSLIIIFLLFYFLKKKIMFFFILFFCFVFAYIFSFEIEFLEQYRAYYIIKNIFNPEIIFLDDSVKDRLLNIFVSFYYGFLNPFGNGFNAFRDALQDFSYIMVLNSSRITGFLGTFSFELGVIMLLIFIYLFIIKPILKIHSNLKFFLFTSLMLLLLQSIPVSYPLIASILALINHSSKKNLNHKVLH